MAAPKSNPGFQHPVTRILLGIGAVAMLVSGIMDLSDSGDEGVRLVLKLVAVVFLAAALGYGLTQNKKLQGQQTPFGPPGHGPGQPGPYPPHGQYPSAQPPQGQQPRGQFPSQGQFPPQGPFPPQGQFPPAGPGATPGDPAQHHR
ncbi:hypothetical protein [Blastococcus sp. Marseille-P5729]|uniref:hypothetical protein n=1 Tax=Blastococcus sp. Marseille-P5729 TaxID=2086582 RepID=UPI00131E03FA|nr:hypothetical protein [Blastococcus sp. Marseille-P5729]